MSKLHLRFGLLALALTQLFGCQKFSKSFQEKAFNCGIEPDQFQNHAQLLQFVDTDNQLLSPTRLQTLQVGLRRDGQWSPLNVSRGGCVLVDASSPGSIVAQDPVRDEAAHWTLKPGETDFNRVALQKRRAFSMRFSCPADAYAADQSLDLNAFYAGDGEAKAGLWLSFAAQRWNPETATLVDEPAHILWDEALDRQSFPQTLRMESLPEGTYRLSARAGYLKPGQSHQDLDVLGNREGCLLRIMRQTPEAPQWKLGARDRHDHEIPELVVPVGQPLDLIKDPDLKLEYCIEPLQYSLNRCEPQRSCVGPAAVFTEAETVTMPEAGQWAVFVRSRDAARHTSALTCARVQASETAPSFSVQWSEAEWNQPFPLLQHPPVTIEARITDLQHDVVGRNYLEESLECRVTVTSSLGNSRDAYYGRCMSGRCAGRALRDWQPCSTSFTVDLSQEWLRSENWESSLTLHVRASDQAGHSQVVRRNLWFSGQRLVNKEIKNPLTGQALSYSQLLQQKDGSLLATTEGQILRSGKKAFEADAQVMAMIGSRATRQALLFEDPEGVALWGFWTFFDEDVPVLGKKMGDRWIFHPTADQGAPQQNCEAFGQSHQGALLCLNSRSISVMNAQHRWQKISLVDTSGATFTCDRSVPLKSRYTESKAGRWLICDKATLFFQASGQNAWQKIKPDEQSLSNFRNIFSSRSEELWILGDQGSNVSKIFVVKNSAWDDRSQGFDDPWFIREEDSPTHDLQNFHEMADGSIRLGTQLYDDTKKSWRSLLPETLQKYEGLAQDQSGGLWTVVEDKALLRFYPKPFILPLEMLGILPGSRLVSIAQEGSSIWASFIQTGHILYRGSAGLFHMESQPWQSLPFGFMRTPAYGEAWTEWFKDRDGHRLVLREDGEIARLDPEQGWTVVSLPSDRPSALKKDFTLIPQGNNFLAQASGGLVWLWDRLTFKEYPLSGADGTLHDFRSAAVDGNGQIWDARRGWDEPLAIYRLKENIWEPYTIQKLPAECSGPLVFFEGDKFLLSCGQRGPVLVHNQTLTFLADVYPEIKWDTEDLMYWTIPVQDKQTSYVFFTTHDFQKEEQFLYRYEPKTGQKKRWKLLDDRRLHFRGDMMTSHVTFDSIVLDPHTPERFLIPSFRYILRPEGDTLKVAVDGNKLLTARGIALEPMSGLIRKLDIQRLGEVWILMSELGVVRYDSIWQAEDKDERPLPAL